jgi:DNA-binding NarL/FixJ family response regulator
MGLSQWPPPPRSSSIGAVTGVLVVDDDPRFREIARSLLAAAGCRVVGEAGDGAAALVVAGHLRPSAALIDVGLPDVDGFELARRLTSDHPGLRVLMTSSDAGPFPQRLMRAAGTAGFVPKTELGSCDLGAYLRA